MKNKTKMFKLLDCNGVQFPKPELIWFNTSYETRGKLSNGFESTVAQFLTVSNAHIITAYLSMSKKDQKRFYKKVCSMCWNSRRAEQVKLILESKGV